MLYREIPCHARLARWVECFWAIDVPAASQRPLSQRVVPDGCIDILFSLRDTSQPHDAELRLIGPMTAPIVYSLQDLPFTLGVRFRPGGAPALLGIQARELQDQSPPLQDALGGAGAELLERMALCPDLPSKIDTLQAALLARLAGIANIDAAMDALIREIQFGDLVEPVEALADRYGFGTRRLRRAFDRWVGLSPKQFSRIMRFQKLLACMHSGSAGNRADLALECGYYDQPHMNREFRELAGISPSGFLAG